MGTRAKGTAALAISLALGGAVLLGCRSDLLKEPGVAPPESGLDARVALLSGSECMGQASVASAPAHCVWPADAARSRAVSAVVEVVAQVGPDGRPASVRVVNAPSSGGFDEAAVACAMKAEYRAPRDESGAPVAGETCPMRLRLDRYASDADGRRAADLPCPVVRTFRPVTAPGTSCEVP